MSLTTFVAKLGAPLDKVIDNNEVMLRAARATLKAEADNEIALVVYSCLAAHDTTWQNVVGKLIAGYPQNAVSRGWQSYNAVFANPAEDASLQEAMRRLLTYQTPQYTYQGNTQEIFTDLVDGEQHYSIFQWYAVADAVKMQLGDTNPHRNHLEQRLEQMLQFELKAHLNLPQYAELQESQPEAVTTNVYEMLWNCRFCGTEKLLAKTHRFCTVCGAPQDPSWRYFPADEDKIAVKDHKFVGADVICASCGTLNSAVSGHCGRCGAPLEETESVRRFESRSQAAGNAFAAQDLYTRLDKESVLEARGIDPTVVKSAPKKQSGMKRWQIGAVLAVVVGIVGFILAAIFWTNEQTVTVSDHSWQRTISIESLQAVEENREGRCSSVAPAGAYREREREEQVDTRRIQVGETCRNVQIDQGDGTFREERQCDPVYENEPVYGPVCYYTVDRWMGARSVAAEGSKADALLWPETNIRNLNCTSLGCEREGGRDEDYKLIFLHNDDTFTCDVDFDDWQAAQVSDAYTIEFGQIGGGARCDTLARAG